MRRQLLPALPTGRPPPPDGRHRHEPCRISLRDAHRACEDVTVKDGGVRYARNGSVRLAYRVLGEGDNTVVWIPGWISNAEILTDPAMPFVPFIEGLTRNTRLVAWDKRGTGLSDPVTHIPPLDERMDDLQAVMDAVGADSAALFGVSEGGPMSILFAATYLAPPTGSTRQAGGLARRQVRRSPRQAHGRWHVRALRRPDQGGALRPRHGSCPRREGQPHPRGVHTGMRAARRRVERTCSPCRRADRCHGRSRRSPCEPHVRDLLAGS